MSDVTVVIPCYNAEKTLKSCLEAVLAQPVPLKEVLVIDDGSSDQTAALASQYPVRLIHHEKNLGLAAARNSGIKNAQSEFIASLDADCVPQEDWLKYLLDKLQQDPAAAVGGKLTEVYIEEPGDHWRSVHMRQYWDEAEGPPSFLFGSNTVFRKDVFSKIGLYDETFRTNYEDVEICSRMKKAGYGFAYEPRAEVRHLKRDTVISVLNSHWHWQLPYYLKENHFVPEHFLTKIKNNIWLADRYMKEDLDNKRTDLLYLNFLLAAHHAFKDFEFHDTQGGVLKGQRTEPSCLAQAVSLIDLIFFYHLNAGRDRLLSLVNRSESLNQNFFAFCLLLSNCLRHQFSDEEFRRYFFRDLCKAIALPLDQDVLNEFIDLTEDPHDWQDLRTKKHPYLKADFLKAATLGFQEWVEGMRIARPEIIDLLKESGKRSRCEKDKTKEER